MEKLRPKEPDLIPNYLASQENILNQSIPTPISKKEHVCKTVDIFTVSSLRFFQIIITNVVQEYIFLAGEENIAEKVQSSFGLCPQSQYSPLRQTPSLEYIRV